MSCTVKSINRHKINQREIDIIKVECKKTNLAHLSLGEDYCS